MATPNVNTQPTQDLNQIMQKISDRRMSDRGLSAYAVYLRVYGPVVLDELRAQMNPGQSSSSRNQNRPGLKVYSQKMREMWDNLPSDQKTVYTQASIKTGFVGREQHSSSSTTRRFNRLNK